MKLSWLIGLLLAVVVSARAQSNVTVLSGPTASTNEPTVITSGWFEAYRGVWTYTNNVLVVDPRITARADKVVACFSTGTNTAHQLQSLKADGGVVLSVDNRKATAEQAEWSANDNKVVLTGNPTVEMPGVPLIRGWKIIFWRGQDRMEVLSDPASTNRVQTVVQPEPAAPR